MKAPNSRFWKTRDGRKVRISRMDSDHLLNAHRFLREHLEAIRDPVTAFYVHGRTLTALSREIFVRDLVPLKVRPTRVAEREQAVRTIEQDLRESLQLLNFPPGFEEDWS